MAKTLSVWSCFGQEEFQMVTPGIESFEVVEWSQCENSRCLVVNWTGAPSLVSFNLLYLQKRRSSSVMLNIT